MTALPSILDLGRHHQTISDAWDAIDKGRTAGDDHAMEIARRGEDVWLHRDMALTDLILTIPAVTLADAAVQLQAALSVVAAEYTDEWPQEARDLIEAHPSDVGVHGTRRDARGGDPAQR